jgi:hypothetical protein
LLACFVSEPLLSFWAENRRFRQVSDESELSAVKSLTQKLRF